MIQVFQRIPQVSSEELLRHLRSAMVSLQRMSRENLTIVSIFFTHLVRRSVSSIISFTHISIGAIVQYSRQRAKTPVGSAAGDRCRDRILPAGPGAWRRLPAMTRTDAPAESNRSGVNIRAACRRSSRLRTCRRHVVVARRQQGIVWKKHYEYQRRSSHLSETT